jgi:hypothetical protein
VVLLPGREPTVSIYRRLQRKARDLALQLQDAVEVLKMAPEEECETEMFVTIRRGKGRLAVPLSQLTVGNASSEQTRQAVEDWHYWVHRGVPVRMNSAVHVKKNLLSLTYG